MKKAINLVLLIINAIAIFFYIRNASLAWAIPEEAGLNPAILGPSMVWGLGALPILLAFVLVDGAWWYVASSRHVGKWAVLVSCLCWAVAVFVDFTHH
jgi:hypothetical protein